MFFRMKSVTPQKKTISWALEQLLGARKLKKILKDCDPALAIERSANHLELDPQKLLESVSRMLDLSPQKEVLPPRRSILQTCGFSAEELMLWKVIPQFSSDPSGYSLSIADPELVSISEFQAQGVKIFLTLHSRIQQAWREYEEEQAFALQIESKQTREEDAEKETEPAIVFSEEHMLPILTDLAEQCQAHGANVVKLMNGSRCCYEFYSRGERYSGSLHPEFVKGLGAFLDPSPVLAFRRPSEEIRLLVLQCEDEAVAGEKSYRLHWEGRRAAVSSSGRILLIDDDERFLFLLATLLKNRNYEVCTARSAREVLPLLHEKSLVPNIILCDVHMPGMDGGGFLAALKQSGLRIPTLILTSDEDRETQAEMALLGASAFLQKREDPRVLLAWVENLMQRGECAHVR